MKSEIDRLVQLDGWRGLAIGLVLLGHFGPQHALRWCGTLGVALFFALSGRLMAQVLFVERMEWKTFLARRTARIYPALFYFIALMTIAAAVRGDWGVVAWAPVHLSLTVNYAIDLGYWPTYDHLWSVCVEAHAYIALALIAMLLGRKSPVRALAICAALGFTNGILSYCLFSETMRAFWRSDVQAASIFASAAVFLHLRGRRFAPWVAPVCLAAAGALIWHGRWPSITLGAEALLLALSVAALDDAPAWLLAILKARPTRLLGGLSYSLYLWQQPAYYLAAGHGVPAPVALAMAFAIASVSYYFIERPARAEINRRWDRWLASKRRPDDAAIYAAGADARP